MIFEIKLAYVQSYSTLLVRVAGFSYHLPLIWRKKAMLYLVQLSFYEMICGICGIKSVKIEKTGNFNYNFHSCMEIHIPHLGKEL